MSDQHTVPDYAGAALLTIDVQRDTLDGAPLEIPGTSAALPAIGRLAAAFRNTSRPIVHIVRFYRRDGSNAERCRRAAIEGGAALLAPGSPGSELAAGVVPVEAASLDPESLLAGEVQQLGPAEVAIYKPRWGAFYKTPLELHLRGLGVTTVVFCGCNFPNCPRTSIYEASERDFRIALATDAVSGLYPLGMRELAGIGVDLSPSRVIAKNVRAAAVSMAHDRT